MAEELIRKEVATRDLCGHAGFRRNREAVPTPTDNPSHVKILHTCSVQSFLQPKKRVLQLVSEVAYPTRKAVEAEVLGS